MKFFVASLLLISGFIANAQSPAPSSLRTDLLLDTDKVWKNGFLTNYTLAQAETQKFKGQYALIRSNRPSFSWIITDTTKGYRQSAYRILVASSKANMDANTGDIWDSGKIQSRQSTGIIPDKGLLKDDKIYYWKVQVWNQSDEPTPFSPAKAFRTDKQLSDYQPPFAPLLKNTQQALTSKNLSDKNVVYDFGKDAFAQITISLTTRSKGDTVWIHVGEAANENGSVNRKPAGSLRYRRLPLVTEKGDQQYALQFTSDKRNTGPKAILMPDYIGEVYPFRYVELELPASVAKVNSLTRDVVNYAFDDDAVNFSSSDTTLNQIWELCKYSIKATTFSGYYVDGDRERIPYEADAFINQLSHYATDTEYNMAKRSLDYLIYHATWPTEWSLQNLLVAWYDYIYSADSRTVAALYPELKAKLLLTLAREDGLISTRTGKQDDAFKKSIHFDTFDGKNVLVDIVDWPQKGVLGLEKQQAGETDGFEFTDYNAVVNAFHYQALVFMSKLAVVLEKNEDAIYYNNAVQKVKTAFQKVFINSKTGLVRDGEGTEHNSLHANMMALAFGLVPEKHHQRVLQHMRSRGMACSVYGSQFLLDALYNTNESKYALSLMNSDAERSWYNMIRTGSTITTEAWDTKYKPNQDWNHAWGAAPANIIVRKLMGVEPLTAGYETVSIKPQPGDLTQAKLELGTLRGKIKTSFENTSDHFLLRLTLPANTSGIVYLPKTYSKSQVRYSGKSIKAVSEGNFWKIMDVEPGNHEFEVIKPGK